MMCRTSVPLLLTAVWIIMTGCQGVPFEKPPIHLNPNMDDQERYDPQETSGFFTDRRTMRPAVSGTVARGELREDTALYLGKDDNGDEINYIPFQITSDLLQRGREQYDIFCSPCHSRIGDGNGIIMRYDYPIPPPSFHDNKLKNLTDGYIFNVISNGIRNMPGYKHQIAVDNRWAVTAYVRALQRSQDARAGDVPNQILQELK